MILFLKWDGLLWVKVIFYLVDFGTKVYFRTPVPLEILFMAKIHFQTKIKNFNGF